MIAYIVMLCHGSLAGIEVFSWTIAGIYQITCERSEKSSVVEGQKKFRLAYVYCQLQTKHEIEKMCYRDVVAHSHRFSFNTFFIPPLPPLRPGILSHSFKSVRQTNPFTIKALRCPAPAVSTDETKLRLQTNEALLIAFSSLRWNGWKSFDASWRVWNECDDFGKARDGKSLKNHSNQLTAVACLFRELKTFVWRRWV